MDFRLAALALAGAAALTVSGHVGAQAGPFAGSTIAWTQKHVAANSSAPGFLSEIASFDSLTRTIWVAGVTGVDVLNASTGVSLGFIDTRAFGSINSVAIHGGIAAVALEATDRKLPGQVLLFDTTTRSLAAGINQIAVGSLPDMLTFTPDGSRLLVANEGTPNWASGGVNDYGQVQTIAANGTRSLGYASAAEQAAKDPVGSVSIIDMASRTVVATPNFTSVSPTGSNLRANTGMDLEPEYIAVNAAGTKAFVTLQEANAMGVIDLTTNTATKLIGLGAKDHGVDGNEIDPLDTGSVVDFKKYANVRGLYMPDGAATFQIGGKTYVVMANEGDFREDDLDRVAGTTFGGAGDLARLRVSSTDSSNGGNLFAAGARSFSIRDEDGNLVFDSGSTLDREAAARGIYDDARSRDKGVEPEGVELMHIDGKLYAFIGLERTLRGAVAVFDITDPVNATFVTMLLTNGTEIRPEGLTGFTMDGFHYLAVTSEGSSFATSGTTLFALAPVSEPGTYAMLLAGLGVVGAIARRRRV